MLGLPTAGPYTSKAISSYVGESEFVNMIKLFKWRDVLQRMAIKLLKSNHGSELVKEWGAGGNDPPRTTRYIVIGTPPFSNSDTPI